MSDSIREFVAFIAPHFREEAAIYGYTANFGAVDLSPARKPNNAIIPDTWNARTLITFQPRHEGSKTGQIMLVVRDSPTATTISYLPPVGNAFEFSINRAGSLRENLSHPETKSELARTPDVVLNFLGLSKAPVLIQTTKSPKARPK